MILTPVLPNEIGEIATALLLISNDKDHLNNRRSCLSQLLAFAWSEALSGSQASTRHKEIGDMPNISAS